MKHISQTIAGVAALVASAVVPFDANAALIDLQFQNTLTAGPPPVTPYTGPAVLGTTGNLWNQIDNPNCPAACVVTGVPLTDVQGNATSATLSFSHAVFVSFRTDGGTFLGTQYATLLSDGIYVNPGYVSPPAVISLAGLQPGAIYDLLVYSATLPTAGLFSTQFTVDGLTSVVTSDANTNLAPGENYAEFATTADPSGTISISMVGLSAGAGPPFGFLNAIQLSAQGEVMPEPGSLTLLGAALVGVALRRATKRPGAV